MSEQILLILKRKLDTLSTRGGTDAEIRRNALKEELQFYVLNFICHHPDYSQWIMYGGSALRIIHNLDRMSIDLDFEIAHPVTDEFLGELGKEIGNHFTSDYGATDNFLTVKVTHGRGLILKFNIGDELSFGHPSDQVHVKIDLNHFIAPKTVIERHPVNHNQLSFVIRTYNMASLMASKIAAIFLRGTRGVGKAIYQEKGRDIYDLLWYMERKVVPDLDYLIAKGIDVRDLRTLFNNLTVQMNKVNNDNLKQDLTPLFLDQNYIGSWLANWLESYLKLLDGYKISTVTTLEGVQVRQNFDTENFSFTFVYNTEEGYPIRVRYTISNYWIDLPGGDLPGEVDGQLEGKIEFTSDARRSKPAHKEKLEQYVTLFYRKTEKYLDRTNRVMFGDSLATKVVRMTADRLNQGEQIVLNRSALLSCDLDDLLK